VSAPPRIDIAGIVERQRLSPFLLRLVLLSWVVTFFDGFDMNAIAYAAPALAAEFHLDKLMLGNIFSIGLVGTMIGGFALGWLGDRIGRRPTIILATASFGAITLAFALAGSYRALLALRLLDGIAIGGMLPVCWALNIEYAPKRYRATIVTVIMIGYSLGTSLAGPIALWLMPLFGWPSLFVFGGGLSLLAAVLLVPALPESIRYLVLEGRRPEGVARLLRQVAPAEPVPENAVFVVSDEAGVARDFRLGLLFKDELRWITPLLWLAYIFSSMAVFFLATWTPLVLEALSFSRPMAAKTASAVALAGALGGLALMRFTDRRGAIAITIMPLLAVPVLLLAGLGDLGPGAFLAATVLTGFFVIGGHFGLHSIAGLFYPSTYRGNGAGWAISIAKIGSIAGPWIAGWLLSTTLPVRAIFAVMAVCPAVFVVAIVGVGRLHAGMLRREALSAQPAIAPGAAGRERPADLRATR
jgi:MFS transporter, AAHS family, 4-hydroxybenzoate transporter